MAKSFYSAKEAAKRLHKSEDELKELVRDGTIREFRDASSVNYRVDDIDKAAATLGLSGSSAGDADSFASSGSASGEILLEPADDSSIELSPASSDILSLDESDPGGLEDSSAGTKPGRPKKEDTAVASVGISVFDDEDLDEHVDPLAQTAISDVAGLGMEGTGSGSGILDLAKSESDDTSLGAELLDEIYTGDDAGGGGSDDTAGDDTRAGLDEMSDGDGGEDSGTVDEEDFAVDVGGEAKGASSGAVVREIVEFPPDAVSTALTAGLFVAVLVMWFAGLASAAMVRGVVPGLLEVVSDNLAIFTGGAFGVTIVASVVTFFVAKRSS